MKALFDYLPITDLSNIDLGLAGLNDGFFSAYITNIFNKEKQNILIITSTLYEANKLFNFISYYTKDVLLYPMDDFLTSEAIAISPDLMVNRLETLDFLTNKNKPMIVITHLMGYLHFLPTKEVYKKNCLNLKVNAEFDPKLLQEKLFHMGYIRETLVTKTGEVGIRGFVIDVFPIGEEHPIRLEFFGDTIDSIRYFDEETQKSIESITSIEIKPYTEFLLEDYTNIDFDIINHKKIKQYAKTVSSIKDYMDNYITIFKDYNQIFFTYQKLEEEILEYRKEKDADFKEDYMFSLNDLYPKKCIHYMTIDNYISYDKKIEVSSFDVKSILPFNENIDLIRKFLKENLEFGKTIVIGLKEYQIKNFIKHIDLPYVLTDELSIEPYRINIVSKEFPQGFVYKNLIVLSDKDLFKLKTFKKTYKTKFKYASKIKDLTKLSIGDYVVHNIHGIGIYNGIKTLSKGILKKDYLEVLYKDKDKLYIPVEKIDLLSKYASQEGTIPKIHKLGGSEWNKTKQRVKSKIKDIADKLLRLHAEREMKQGFMFSKDTEFQRQFEEEFAYTPTKDQLLAVEQIKDDMESSHPMDRLLCGDVGYGKTEVAFRAVFKAVMDSKQVLFLCPTTILSSQHFENAKQRFTNFPVQIELLNRFTSKKETTRILNGLKDGTIDVVIGTHRLLGKDVLPKDLGLLVIDEEQRFGVTHKERIKEYKSNVDVLTLTATPIPRTLQMSMVGLRSLSLIETPPVDRYPVQTYVVEESDQLIKEAIYKELARNGQVFLLYNRVETIMEEVDRISRLVPLARVTFAHGQMTKEEIENRMFSFINCEFDVLVCTTIIETGIDIPNVNTLIIKDADRFGLSQLYQIRGRVGRSNKIAYAYLMYKPYKLLNETAIKRLNVIKEFTELGSGFSIATRDLSIRGAGDILGSEQAGFIDTVGIDLYLKMLQDEINLLKGIKKEEETTDDKPLLDVETHINDKYVSETDLKIEIHRKINEIDSLEKINQVESELEDRFGKIDESLRIYMYEEWFEKLAKEFEIEQVRQTKNSIELYFSLNITKKIDIEELFVNAFHISTMFRFQSKMDKMIIILDTIKLEKHPVYYIVDLISKIKLKS